MRNVIMLGLVAFLLSLSFTAPVAAGSLEDGQAAYAGGDYATALLLLRPLAEQGDAGAQFDLSVMYGNGQGVPQDYAEAARWCRKAANQGDAAAQVFLGSMYANGQGVPQDYAEAIRLLRPLADQGDASAQFFLGLMYMKGEGVPQDYAQAYKWFTLPASQPSVVHDEAVKARDFVAAKMTPGGHLAPPSRPVGVSVMSVAILIVVVRWWWRGPNRLWLREWLRVWKSK